MEQRSLIAYDEYFKSAQKFDYFVTGISGALFAYIAQTYQPREIRFSPDTLEPVALLFLALAFFFGMKRIEAGVTSSGSNFISLDAGEKAGNMTEALGRSTPGYNPYSGGLIHPEQISAQREKHMHQAKASLKQTKVFAGKADKYYSYRNLFLYGGFAAILLSKILQPYS